MIYFANNAYICKFSCVESSFSGCFALGIKDFQEVFHYGVNDLCQRNVYMPFPLIFRSG